MVVLFKNLIYKYKQLFADRKYLGFFLWGLFLFILSIILSFFAIHYVDGYSIGYVVPDLILDHIPTLNVTYLFFQGAFIFFVATIVILLLFPDFMPFALIASALLFTVRSLFMTLTHLSAPVISHYSYINYKHDVANTLFTISSGNDLFFSGHVGYPFLLALIFWKKKFLRYFFIACSIISSFAVLFGHLHYSIDVFSAFFITYGVFEISKRVFKKQYSLYNSGENKSNE